MTKYDNPQRTRNVGSRHPLLEKYGVDAVPIGHAELATWRENFKAVRFHHQPTNLVITGAIDDLWLDAQRRFVVVDYKATSKAEPITALDQGWHAGYKRQMEICQWLLRRPRSPAARNATRFPHHAGRFFPCHADDP